VLGQSVDPADRFLDSPALVGIDRNVDAIAGRGPGQLQPSVVRLEVATDFDLHHPEARTYGLADQPFELVVVVAEPPG
jgi:hypothetical protein